MPLEDTCSAVFFLAATTGVYAGGGRGFETFGVRGSLRTLDIVVVLNVDVSCTLHPGSTSHAN